MTRICFSVCRIHRLLVQSVFGLMTALCISACSQQAGPELITKAEYGEGWPFVHHDQGILFCESKSFGGIKRPLVIIKLGHEDYGLNGAAHGVGGYKDARSQMGRTEWDTYELGASDDILKRGLEKCQ